MNVKLTAVAVAVMLTVVGGAAAVSGTTMSAMNDADTTRDADVTAAYDDGTVAVTVTNGGEAVENATVEVAGEEYVTDANGTVVAENVSDDEVTVEVEVDGLEAELEYVLQDGELTLVEETYEYADADADEEEREEAEGDEEEVDEEEDADEEAADDGADEDEVEEEDGEQEDADEETEDE